MNSTQVALRATAAATCATQPARPCHPRQASIETLRGLALLLLVGFHATFEDPAGLSPAVQRHPLYDYLGASLSFIRMPLFTVISGYVYGVRPLAGTSPLQLLRGKVRRLLVPLVTAVTITLGAAHLSGGANSAALPPAQLYRAYLFGYSHFWFLQAMLWVFLAIAWIEHLRWMERPGTWGLLLLVACGAKYVLPEARFFSLGGGLYLLPFFVLGVGLKRFETVLAHPAALSSVAVVAFGGLLLQQGAMQALCELNLHKTGPLGTVVGLCSTYCLVLTRRSVPVLARLGGYSYTVYLYHHLGLSIGKRLYQACGVPSYELVVLCECLAGIGIGVCLDHVLRRLPIARTVFLGLAPPQTPPTRIGT